MNAGRAVRRSVPLLFTEQKADLSSAFTGVPDSSKPKPQKSSGGYGKQNPYPPELFCGVPGERTFYRVKVLRKLVSR